MVSFFIDAADMLGVPKSVAAIYGICFASPEPLSFSDINERLDISSGSISQGLRVLREVGALKVAEPGLAVEPSNGTAEQRAGSKSGEPSHGEAEADEPVDSSTGRLMSARSAARYEPDLELRNLVLHWIEKRLQAHLTSGRTRLRQIVESIPQADAGSDTLKTRFESLQTWQDKAHSLLPIAKTVLKLT